jgi:predicted Zn-dependent protease
MDGEALFVACGDRIYRIIGYGPPAGWKHYSKVVRQSLLSFAELGDPGALAVQPLRLEVIGLPRATTLREYYQRRGCPVSLSELALLNRRDPDSEIPQGQLIKWITNGQQ